MKILKDNFNLRPRKFLLIFSIFCISLVKINNYYVERQRDQTFYSLISALRRSDKTELKSICTQRMYYNIENFVKYGGLSGCTIYDETPSSIRNSSWLVWKNWTEKFNSEEITGWKWTGDSDEYSPTYSTPQSAEFRLRRIGGHWKVSSLMVLAR